MAIVKSACGAANLVAALFGINPTELKARLGLPTGYEKCPECGELVKLTFRGYCSRKCYHESRFISVVCDECGKLFKRQESQLTYRIGKRGRQHVFCSKQCTGSYLGRNYGFGKHPEKAGWPPGRKRDKRGCKYGADTIETIHQLQQNGYRLSPIARLLGIPQGTIYHLAKTPLP